MASYLLPTKSKTSHLPTQTKVLTRASSINTSVRAGSHHNYSQSDNYSGLGLTNDRLQRPQRHRRSRPFLSEDSDSVDNLSAELSVDETFQRGRLWFPKDAFYGRRDELELLEKLYHTCCPTNGDALKDSSVDQSQDEDCSPQHATLPPNPSLDSKFSTTTRAGAPITSPLFDKDDKKESSNLSCHYHRGPRERRHGNPRKNPLFSSRSASLPEIPLSPMLETAEEEEDEIPPMSPKMQQPRSNSAFFFGHKPPLWNSNMAPPRNQSMAEITKQQQQQQIGEELSSSSGKLVFVGGFPESGKTRLVQEFLNGIGVSSSLSKPLHHHRHQRRHHVVTASFEQRNSTPLGTLAVALSSWIVQLCSSRSSSAEDGGEWYEGQCRLLEEHLDESSILDEKDQHLLLELIPTLVLVLGRAGGRSMRPKKTATRSDSEDDALEDGLYSPSRESETADEHEKRIKTSFQQLLKVICTFSDCPVIFFLDNLQWADSISLEVLNVFMTDKDVRDNFMLIGAFRSNEVAQRQNHNHREIHPLLSWMNRMEFESGRNGQPTLTRINLENHSPSEISFWMANVLKLHIDEISSLTQIIYKKTAGNIGCAKKALKELHSKKMLHFNFISCRWEWGEEANVDDATTISYNLVDVNVVKLQFLSKTSQTILAVAAFLRSGISYFEMSTLHAFLMDSTSDFLWDKNDRLCLEELELEGLLEKAVHDGLLQKYHNSPDKYQFCHDRIQEAARSLLVTNKAKEMVRVQLGKFLMANYAAYFKSKKRTRNKTRRTDWMLFAAADHFNSTPLRSHDDDLDPMHIAKLNWEVGAKAVRQCAFPQACDYFDKGIEAMESCTSSASSSPWESQYDLAYRLYQASANARHAVGDYEICGKHSQQVLHHAKTLAEKLPVYQCMESCLSRQGKHEEAMRLDIVVAQSMGIYPKRFQKALIMRDLLKVKQLLGKYSNEEILQFPIISDKMRLGAMSFFARIARRASLSGDFDVLLLVCLSSIIYTFQQGLCGEAAIAFAYCGGICCRTSGDRAMGRRLGRLATQVQKVCRSIQLDCWVDLIVGFWIDAWSAPLTQCLKTLQNGFHAGVANGDVEGAGWNGLCSNITAFQTGFPLKILLETGNILLEHYDRYKIFSCRSDLSPMISHYQHLMGVKKPDWGEIRKRLRSSGTTGGMNCESQLYACLAYYLGQIELSDEALKHWKRKERKKKGARHSYFTTSTTLLFEVLIPCALFRQSGKRKYKIRANKAMKKMCRSVKTGALNDLHKVYIMDAEFAATFYRQKVETTQKKFDLAVQVASKAGFVQDAALANELAGEFFLRRRCEDEQLAVGYLSRAYALYHEWGAQAKVAQIVARRGMRINQDESLSSNKGSSFLSDKYRLSHKNLGFMARSVHLDHLSEEDVSFSESESGYF